MMDNEDKLIEDLELLISDFHQSCISEAHNIQCEEGAGYFVSIAAIHTYTARMKRVLRDDKYRDYLLLTNKLKGLKQ